MLPATYFQIAEEKNTHINILFKTESKQVCKDVNCWIYVHCTILSIFLFENFLNKGEKKRFKRSKTLILLSKAILPIPVFHGFFSQPQ